MHKNVASAVVDCDRNGQESIGKTRKFVELILVSLLLAFLLVLPRIPGIDLAVSPDEPLWLARSANFYQAVANQDWAFTFQVEHPGVTVMYAGMVSFLAQFRDLATAAPLPFDWESRASEAWLSENLPVSPLNLLIGGRWVVVGLVTLLLLLSYFPLRRLFGALPAFFAVLFVGWSPFGLALTQRLHPDSLVGVFLLLGVLSFLAWLHAGRANRYLVLSAVAIALAGLTKTPAIFAIPALLGFVAVEWWRTQRTRAQALSLVRMLLLWGGLAGILVVVLWPAMWVQPVQTVTQMILGAASHAEGHSNPNFFWGEIVEDPSAWFYPIALLYRMTPATLIGLFLACLQLFFLRSPLFQVSQTRTAILSILAYVVIFVAGISLSAKTSDRYAVPALLALDVVAAIGWFGLTQLVWQHKWLQPLRQRFSVIDPIGPAGGVALVLLLLHGSLAAYHAPYYFTYFNPLVGGVATAPDMLVIGWGEGIDQAALWLNEYDQGLGRPAVSAYTLGSFSYFYDQSAYTDKPRRVWPAAGERGDWRELDYMVTYVNQWQRQLPDAERLDFFAQHTPIYTYWFRGLELARVYDLVETLPPPNDKVDGRRFIDFGDAIRLMDFRISPSLNAPGESGEVALYLKSIDQMAYNASVLLRLLAADGSEVWRSEGWPYGAPTREWPLRELRRDARAVDLPSTLPTGIYKLNVAFYDTESVDPLRVSYPGNASLTAGEDSADLALLQIGEPTPLASEDALTWDFGELVRLADFTLPERVAAGEPLHFSVTWQSLQSTPYRYTVFVHVLDAAGQLVAQQDRDPQHGFAPTQLWQPGMIFHDTYSIDLPEGLSATELSIRIGLYDSNGARLPSSAAGLPSADAADLGVFRID